MWIRIYFTINKCLAKLLHLQRSRSKHEDTLKYIEWTIKHKPNENLQHHFSTFYWQYLHRTVFKDRYWQYLHRTVFKDRYWQDLHRTVFKDRYWQHLHRTVFKDRYWQYLHRTVFKDSYWQYCWGVSRSVTHKYQRWIWFTLSYAMLKALLRLAAVRDTKQAGELRGDTAHFIASSSARFFMKQNGSIYRPLTQTATCLLRLYSSKHIAENS